MKEHYGHIYKITCKINNKIYIGQTIRPISSRWRVHCWDAENRDTRTAFANAIRKHGKENFILSTICTANNKKELNLREQTAIRLYKSLVSQKGYNIEKGGNKPKMSEETKKKISIANKGKRKPVGFSEKLRKINLGHKRPEWVKKRMSAAQKKWNISNPGKTHTEETKRKISIAHKGKIRTKEHSKNISIAKKGIKWSKEARKKVSLARKGRLTIDTRKPILCIETNKKYLSLTNASKKLNISYSSLGKHLKGKLKTAGGLTFKFL